MSDKQNIAIVGYSGHALVVLESAKHMGLFVDFYTERKIVPFNPFSLTYLGDEGDEYFEWNRLDAFILGIGDNRLRDKIAQRIKGMGKAICNVIHPSSTVSIWAQMGTGNYIAPQVALNAFAQIGDNCILNTGSIVEHECKLGSSVHLAPGAVLAGNVSVGDLTFIGANAVVKQGLNIGKNVTVGAGAVVIEDIPDNTIFVGNPAREIKKKS